MFHSKIISIMATLLNDSNYVSLIGFIAVEAQVKEFEKSAVARFPLSISRTETNGGTQVRKSALISCECWNKDYFALFTKSKLLQVAGFLKPDEWTDEAGIKHNRIIFVVTHVTDPEEARKLAKARMKAV
jgi:single-strand DNA-binding protein